MLKFTCSRSPEEVLSETLGTDFSIKIAVYLVFQGRRVIRPHFQKSRALALTYDVITCILTVLSVSEGGVPFQLLQLRMCIDYWR